MLVLEIVKMLLVLEIVKMMLVLEIVKMLLVLEIVKMLLVLEIVKLNIYSPHRLQSCNCNTTILLCKEYCSVVVVEIDDVNC